jgi:hypothetical protein
MVSRKRLQCPLLDQRHGGLGADLVLRPGAARGADGADRLAVLDERYTVARANHAVKRQRLDVAVSDAVFEDFGLAAGDGRRARRVRGRSYTNGLRD